ncbi:FG-GAP-like repeat-containing protein [Reichenbachiella agarivorans]|uniref:FG-GAP-like repeat-containing protein n=1 Tax=Reichenbachiella agarivorans TaxID=2979464 RepID=A0ABY6CPZ6_9BACT|nr:FG-GAP-like repeat-containing protein [Reichenbachiella agarivorans]UXP31859.1 FG-GAP-like repeat-containing protein [Reichenbachiella agarivorans]
MKISQFALIVALCLTVSTVFAQVPYINNINPSSAAAGEVVNIVGSNFPTTNVVVFFGGAMATSVDATETLIKATVPFGATFEQITVINTTSGEIATSNKKFNYSFEGQNLTAAQMSAAMGDKKTFATDKVQTQDICTCDFDQDGDLDIAISNVGANDISIFTNTKSGIGSTNLTFTRTEISNGSPVTNVICGDMDGDGYPDLAANKLGGAASLFVYRNNTATAGSVDNPSFATKQDLIMPDDGDGNFRKPGRFALGDLDLDGRPELVVAMEDENLVYYFKNNSNRAVTPNVISFVATPQVLTASENSGSSGLGGIDIADLNRDGFPEIIVSNLTESGFYVFNNIGQPGTISFSSAVRHTTGSNIRTIKTGDLNNDGLVDLVLTNSDISIDLIEIAQNTTSGTGVNASFASPIQITGISTSWGLDLGDFDGDGDLDIAVASFGSNNYYVIMNQNPASILPASYQVSNIAITQNSRNIKVADIDSDGRPDFLFTHNSTSSGNGFLGVKFNNACYTPTITPSGSLKLCAGESVDLVAPLTGLSYVWKKGSTVLPTTTNTHTVAAADAGSYTVSVDDNCDNVSAAVVVQNLGGTYTQPSFVFSNATPCLGEEVTLTITADASNNYLLTGPGDFSVESTIPADIKIASMDVNLSGEYILTTTSTATGCARSSVPVLLNMVAIPVVAVNNPVPDVFCTGTTINLSTSVFNGYTYDWKLNGVSYAPVETDPTNLVASTAGAYSVTISKSGCDYTSEVRNLTTVAPPVSTFTTSDDTKCEDAEITYTAGSTGAFTIVNTWDFGDGSTTQTGNTVNYAHPMAGNYTVSLTASYENISNCPYTPMTKDMTIVATPAGTALDLIESDNSDVTNYEKCPENELLLRVADQYLNYDWKTIVDTDSTSISTQTTARVGDETRVTVQLTDDLGCVFHANEISVSNYADGGIHITTVSPNQITTDPELGQIINLIDDQYEVVLRVDDATNPMWSPESYIDNPTANEVTATPKNAREMISVEGIDILGCLVTDSVLLITPGVKADKSFTPNGDGIGDCWQISNVSGTDCTVSIFDAKGRKIRDIRFSPDDSFDDCVWDGNQSNGGALPDGTYYYIMSCSDSQNESGGAIFMAR